MSRLAVVCGGSRGIGKAVSLLLAERGCRLAVVSRNEDAARATVASLNGGTTVPYLLRLCIEALLILQLVWHVVVCSNTLSVCPLAAHIALSCDVSKEQEVQKIFETIQKTSGNISYLVNAAGINRWGHSAEAFNVMSKIPEGWHACVCVCVQGCSVIKDQAGGDGGSAPHQSTGHHADLQGCIAQHVAHSGSCYCQYWYWYIIIYI